MKHKFMQIRGSLRASIVAALAIGIGLGFSVPLHADSASTQDVPANSEKNKTAQTTLPIVSVTGIAPQQGAELPAMMLPYNSQTATAGDFDRAGVLDSTDYMNRRMEGVTINSAQGNPLQPDLQFRGFTATPLLGGSEGVSVYVDGVRVNEVFGDTINWDLIPEEAMSKLTLLSGANPIFGLNTLGGVIQIQTKNGFTDPGTELQSYAGSFGRIESTVQSGGNNGTWGYYLLANHFEEDGWRDISASKASSVFGTLSWRGENATLDLHLAHSETDLTGNGAQSIQILQLARKSVFTAPDETQNFYSGISAQGTYKFNDDTLLTATLFTRQVNTRSYNGDGSDFDECDDNDDILCDDDGNAVRDQHGNTLSSDYNAINNIGVRKQFAYGGALQAVFKQSIFGLANQFVAGIDYDRGRVDYSSVLEASYLVPFSGDQYSFLTASNVGIFVPDDALAVHINDNNQGLYLTDTLSLTDQLALTASARYNHTRITINDPTGVNPDLDGQHAYHRINPALGFTYQFNRALNFYAGYSESTRAPTPVELTCASPDAPCKLPNDFVADPDLNQVLARSWEAGLRGTFGGRDADWLGETQWKLGVYRTTNSNDILFQSTGGAQSNEGFYANVGDTRRQGLQASLSGKLFDNRLDWFASYSYLDAKFLTSFEENAANNPFADEDTGLIQVNKGNRIPSLPKNAIKIGADFALTRSFSIGGDAAYNSSQYLRGDEANVIAPIGGFTVVNLHASYRVNERLRFFARTDNVLNHKYYNFGILGDATDIYPQFTDPRFLSPGEPRGAWLGVALDL